MRHRWYGWRLFVAAAVCFPCGEVELVSAQEEGVRLNGA